MTNVYPVSWRLFGGTKSGIGYLRIWEGHHQWFVFGKFYILMIKTNTLKPKPKCYMVFLRFVLQIFPYLQGKLLKVAMFRYYIHKSYQYKIRFWKKNYNPSRIEIFILGDFQNVSGFLFWVGPMILAQ
jgi:hypothetical protein